jgi:REP element-mobilizing transposase RayT
MFTHLIFSTKNRTPILTADIRPRLFEYMGGIIRGLGGQSILINGVEDHVHALTVSPTTVTTADFMRDLKGDSSAWAKDALKLPQFAWQTGYAAFSVSKSAVPAVRAYIVNQEEHHRRITFQEEYLQFLKRHEIDYDERFVFD